MFIEPHQAHNNYLAQINFSKFYDLKSSIFFNVSQKKIESWKKISFGWDVKKYDSIKKTLENVQVKITLKIETVPKAILSKR